MEQTDSTTPEMASVLIELARRLNSENRFVESEMMYERVFDELAPADYLEDLNRLAKIKRALGKLWDAEQLLTQIIYLRQKMTNPDELALSDDLLELGNVYHDQEKFDQALKLYKTSLLIRDVLAPNGYLVAQCLNDIGELYRETKKLDEAETSYNEALSILENGSQGQGHPVLVQVLNNQGLLLQTRGNYAAAELSFRRALHTNQTDSIVHATTMHNLGRLLYKKDTPDFKASETLLLKALELRRSLGLTYPDLVISHKDLAELYKLNGRIEDAEVELTKALKLTERVLGASNYKIVDLLLPLAAVYKDRQNYQKATEYYKKALSIFLAQDQSTKAAKVAEEIARMPVPALLHIVPDVPPGKGFNIAINQMPPLEPAGASPSRYIENAQEMLVCLSDFNAPTQDIDQVSDIDVVVPQSIIDKWFEQRG